MKRATRKPEPVPTRAQIRRIARDVRLGVDLRVAMAGCGFDGKLASRWLRRGLSGVEPYWSFGIAVAHAEDAGLRDALKIVAKAAKRNPKAARWLKGFLKRHPDAADLLTD